MPWTDSPPSDGPLLADRYRLVSRIGEGGMAGVYRAWDDRLRVWRAAKVLLPEFARKKKLRKRFEREAHTMARLEHANLVRVVDVGTSGALPFIVMELVPCGTLMQWVDRNGPMPEVTAVDAMLQVARGLAEVHNNGVIHRDIKPHNVLINEQGLCKITDFGIAQETEEGLTRAGSVMGTMGYMAPEQRNDAAAVDVRADVYGFGATMWKLLTGRPLRDLFMYTEDASIMEGIDEGLAEILMACLSYAREDRPEDMSEVIDALEAVRETLPAPAPGTPDLPIQGQIESVEAASDTFAEILPAFTLSTDLHSATSELEDSFDDSSFSHTKLEAPKNLPGLPYGLPQRMEDAPSDAGGSGGDDGGKPAWLVEDEPTEDGAYEIGVPSSFVKSPAPEQEEFAATMLYDASSQEAEVYMVDDTTEEGPEPTEVPVADAPVLVSTEEPAQQRGEEPQVEEGPGFNVGLVLRLGLALSFVVLVGLGSLLYWSNTVVQEAALVSERASQKFYAILDTERNVATALVHFDPNARTLEGLFLDYQDHPREPERWERAMTFVDDLQVYGQAVATKKSAQAREVQGQINRLDAARKQARASRMAWVDASSSFPGVLTASLGLAPAPPFDAKAVGEP